MFFILLDAPNRVVALLKQVVQFRQRNSRAKWLDWLASMFGIVVPPAAARW
jgi:hypothetical protein